MTIKFKGCQKLQLGEKTFLALELQSYEEIRNANEICDKVNSVNALHVAEIKRHREKRSLDSNKYLWKLLNEMAMKLTNAHAIVKADDLYIKMLKSYGQGTVIKVKKGESERVLSVFSYFEEHEKLFDDTGTYYRVWVGSSNYNTEEMSALLKGVINECWDIGLDPRTPNELIKLHNLMEQER